MRSLWLTRHGHTEHSDASTLNSELDRQVLLDETGREQARGLAAAVETEPPQVCFSSEFSRTRETAELIVERIGPTVEPLRALNEVAFGSWFERRTYQEYVEWCTEHGLFETPPGEGGQPFADTLLRLHSVFTDICARPEPVGLVVTHGFPVSFLRRMPALVPGETLFPFPGAAPAELYRIDVHTALCGLAQVPERVKVAAEKTVDGRRWWEARQ